MVNDSIVKIKSLLEQSNKLIVQKELDQATLLATESLGLSKANNYSEGQLNSLLLLGAICNIQAKYLGDYNISIKAQDYAEEAQLIVSNEQANNGVNIDLLLILGYCYLNRKQYDKSKAQFESAEQLSIKQNDIDRTMLSIVAKSRLAVAQNKFKSALDLVEGCLEIVGDESTDILDSTKAEVYFELSKIYVKRQNHNKVLDVSTELLSLSKRTNDIEKEMTALSNIGIFYAVKAKYKLAMQHFLEALDKSKKIGYRSFTSNCLINIATIYAQLYNFNDALDRYHTVLKEYNDVINDNTRVIVFNNLGNIYFSTERIDLAEEQFNNALKLAKECNYKEMEAHSYAQLSKTAAKVNNFEKAHSNADLAELLIQELGEINGKQINLINRGDIHFHQKDYPMAMKLISKGVVLSKRMKDEASEIRGYQLLAKVYRELGAFEQALNYQMIYSKVQEDFNKEIRNRQIIDLEIKYAIKEKQQEIEQLVKENKLQSLLLEQSDQLSKQNTQLLQVNDELRQFAYVVSHDLKEPLRMIGSYTQLIHRLHHEVFTKDSTTYFGFITEGVERMNELLEGLLKYATVGKSDLDMKLVDLGEAVELAVINLSVSIQESKAKINNRKLPTINTNRSLWIQVFQNLISNAIKFHRKDITPEINIDYEQTKTEIIIKVADNGIGIEREFKDRIFVIFQRLHARSKYEGTGIGLAICQKIMQRLDGRIWFESEVGKGTVFYCAVPVQNA